ncbi:MAG: GSU2403 family nucleotidyltransferase fold protein [Rhizobiaceae bacterium]
MPYSELRPDQQRQLIDAVETFEAWRDAKTERRRRFAGSMRWAERGGHQYLLRKIGQRERSLGPRSEETNEAYENFIRGRDRNHDQLSGLAAKLDHMAPINRALGLGRVPKIAARILRHLDERELLGSQLVVVGTNALFAYEAKAGVRIASGLLATEDVDLLLDIRQRLSLVGREVRETGLLGLLRRIDHSFSPRRSLDFRAVNRDGYYVDLIRPEERDILRSKTPDALSDLSEELHGSPIAGLNWLVNAPKFEAVAIADDGYPVPMACPDPRVFALHKAWISRDMRRDPRKKGRDIEQARTAADIASSRLGMSFDDASALSVLPTSIRALRSTIQSLPSEGSQDDESTGRAEPRW